MEFLSHLQQKISAAKQKMNQEYSAPKNDKSENSTSLKKKNE